MKRISMSRFRSLATAAIWRCNSAKLSRRCRPGLPVTVWDQPFATSLAMATSCRSAARASEGAKRYRMPAVINSAAVPTTRKTIARIAASPSAATAGCTCDSQFEREQQLQGNVPRTDSGRHEERHEPEDVRDGRDRNQIAIAGERKRERARVQSVEHEQQAQSHDQPAKRIPRQTGDHPVQFHARNWWALAPRRQRLTRLTNRFRPTRPIDAAASGRISQYRLTSGGWPPRWRTSSSNPFHSDSGRSKTPTAHPIPPRRCSRKSP